VSYIHPAYYGLSTVNWKAKLLQISTNNINIYFKSSQTNLCKNVSPWSRYIRNVGTSNQSVTSNHIYTPSNFVTAKIRRNRLGLLSVKINALPGNAIFEKETKSWFHASENHDDRAPYCEEEASHSQSIWNNRNLSDAL